jgi:hypothetical protein
MRLQRPKRQNIRAYEEVPAEKEPEGQRAIIINSTDKIRNADPGNKDLRSTTSGISGISREGLAFNRSASNGK